MHGNEKSGAIGTGSPCLILGAGVSGKAAENLLRAEGAAVFVAPATEGGAVVERFAGEASTSAGSGPSAGASSLTVVASPGIPPGDPEIVRAKELGMRVIGEMQLGVSRFKGRVIAITGSKGKSSLVKLVADTLCLAGVRAVPCGNYGLAMCGVAAMNPQPDVAVLECSSFQLEYGPMSPAPDAALLLNIMPDHLDRHGTMENYRAAKMNIFGNMRDDALRLMPEDLTAPQMSTFLAPEDFTAPQAPTVPTPVGTPVGAPVGSYFDNEILRPAAVAAVKILHWFGLSDAQISAGFAAFEPLPHRMEKVAEHAGVLFVNDSKATSLAAMLAAVRMSAKPVFLIAGGRLKEKDLPDGKILLESGVKKAYIVGECAGLMSDVWRSDLPTEVCGVMKRAVSSAFGDALAAGGGTVLLSPGTASFDQYTNYEKRGEDFAAEVKNITTAI